MPAAGRRLRRRRRASARRALQLLAPQSNFLIPFEGTPLAKEWNLTPQRALRILAMVRFVCPDVEVRLATRLVFGMINSIVEWYRPDGRGMNEREVADQDRGGAVAKGVVERTQGHPPQFVAVGTVGEPLR